MKIDSVLKPKHMGWASGAVLAVILLIVLTRSGTKASVQAPPPPIVEVATVEQRDGPVYGEWIGTLTGQVNADVKAQVTGYRSTQINASAAPGYSSDQATAALEDVFMQTMPHEMGFDYLGMRIPMMSISHSDLMPIRTERSDAGLSQCEIVIDIRQEFCLFSLS